MNGVTIRVLEAPLRIALIIGLVALLAVPASAQRMHGKKDQSEGKQQSTAEQKKKAREAEEAYKATLRSIPRPEARRSLEEYALADVPPVSILGALQFDPAKRAKSMSLPAPRGSFFDDGKRATSDRYAA
jgi:hypothetical protein